MAQPDAQPVIANVVVPQAIAGEQIEYEVTVLGIVFGRVQTAVGAPGLVHGKPAIIVRSRGTSTGPIDLLGQMSWDMATTIDLETGYAVHETEELVATRNGDGHKRRYHADRPFATSAHHHNAHSAVGVVRGWRSQLGDQLAMDVHFGDELLAVELRDAAREMVGSTPAVRYEGRAAGKWNVTTWVSDDADRVPLRLRTQTMLGDVVIALVAYD